tara:strand:- start:1783 stop:2877 length:1095 start_codon:yes stop_codon:yes gene_type:complete
MTNAVQNRRKQGQQTKPIVTNGSMDIAQRGTSSTGVNSDGYTTCDRWRTNIDSYGAYTITQSTTVPTGQGFSSSFKIDCTTADASPGSGDLFTFEQRFEGQEVQMFKKGTSSAERYTLAFWIRSNLTGNFTVNLVDSDNSRRIGSLVNIAQADTWEKKVISFPKDTTGAFDDDNADSFRIQFFLGVGSNFTSGTLPTSAWESATTANFAAGQSAFIGSNTDNELFITGVQLEVGDFNSDTIPPFQFENAGTNLARCQRYCYQEDNSDTYHNQVSGFFSGSTLFIGLLALPVAMRSSPSITTSGNYETAGTSSLDASSIILVDSAGTDLTKIQIRATVSGATAGQGTVLRNKNDATAIFRLTSEI